MRERERRDADTAWLGMAALDTRRLPLAAGTTSWGTLALRYSVTT